MFKIFPDIKYTRSSLSEEVNLISIPIKYNSEEEYLLKIKAKYAIYVLVDTF